jgi:hypothetical protein
MTIRIFPSDMDTLQFEAVKMALKQNKDGYVLTMTVHPDEVPDALLRDYVGARYQVVMVRLADDDAPLDRREFEGHRAVRLAGVLCREPEFWKFLFQSDEIFDPTEDEATNWLRTFLGIKSRTELKINQEARDRLSKLNKDYMEWTKN